ncbi:RDD family protein [Helicobacter sp. 11S02596-1]|nr:RDD family protein [Helicobacter sp. 11S02596-1]
MQTFFHASLQTLQQIHTFGRIKAFITDMFMIYTPILYITAYVVLGSAQGFRDNQTSIFICVCLYGVISALFISISSQTPGLRYAGLMAVRTNGKKMGFLRALVRFFIWILGTTFLFGLCTPFFRKDKKCLHDIVCGTTIIKKTQK